MNQNLSFILDALIIAYIIYRFLIITKGTRLLQVLVLTGLTLFAYYLSSESLLDLAGFRWLIEKFWLALLVVVVILFQDDIRVMWARARWLSLFGRAQRASVEQYVVEEIVKTARELVQKGIGGLIVVQRETDLNPYISPGALRIGAVVSKDLLYALFNPGRANPTHDGAVIIQGNRVAAARCVLPLSRQKEFPAELGMRHRAAVGITEQCDAVAVIISESTSKISLAVQGSLEFGITENELRERLIGLLSPVHRESLKARIEKTLLLRGRQSGDQEKAD